MNSNTDKLKCIAGLLLLGCFMEAAQGADVMLRERAVPSKSVVYLGDIADIAAASRSEVDRLTTTLLMPAPAPGTQIYLRKSQLRDLLVSRGVDIRSIRLSGADVVEVGLPKAKDHDNAFVGHPATSAPDTGSVLEAAIGNYLRDQTGHDDWEIEFRDLGARGQRHRIRDGSKLIVAGGRQPWTGRQMFRVRTREMVDPVTIYTQVSKNQTVLFTRRAIERGEMIRAADVEERRFDGQAPNSAAVSIDDVIGKEAVQSITAGAIVHTRYLRAPLLVQRGETVDVYARTRGIAVRTLATARQDGALGDLVQVESLDGEERFAARVQGRRSLVVTASGSKVEDFALMNRDEMGTRLR